MKSNKIVPKLPKEMEERLKEVISMMESLLNYAYWQGKIDIINEIKEGSANKVSKKEEKAK